MEWKHLFLFMVVAIPSVAILTRLIAWLGRSKKPKGSPALVEARKFLEGSDEPEPTVGKPYATYEEYRDDLRGTVDLDEVLARCRAGVPSPKKEEWKEKMAQARSKLADIQKRLEGGTPPPFPVAQFHRWHRKLSTGELIVHMQTPDNLPCSAGFADFLRGNQTIERLLTTEVEIAIPRVGEWWQKRDCVQHPTPRTTGHHLVESSDVWFTSKDREGNSLCRCLLPVGFGKGA